MTIWLRAASGRTFAFRASFWVARIFSANAPPERQGIGGETIAPRLTMARTFFPPCCRPRTISPPFFHPSRDRSNSIPCPQGPVFFISNPLPDAPFLSGTLEWSRWRSGTFEFGPEALALGPTKYAAEPPFLTLGQAGFRPQQIKKRHKPSSRRIIRRAIVKLFASANSQDAVLTKASTFVLATNLLSSLLTTAPAN